MDDEQLTNDQVGDETPSAGDITLLDYAKSKGYKEDGPKSPEEFLAYDKVKGQQVNSEFNEYRRNADREIRQMKARIEKMGQAAPGTSASPEKARLQEELEDATLDGNFEKVKDISDKLMDLSAASANPPAIDDSKVKEAFDQFAKDNPWVEKDPKAAEFCKKEIEWLTRDTDMSAQEILAKAGEFTKKEFAYLDEKDKKFAPPFGDGGSVGAKPKTFTARDLPTDNDRADLARMAKSRARELGITEQKATQQLLQNYRKLSGK